jgi:hypothetical protein
MNFQEGHVFSECSGAEADGKCIDNIANPLLMPNNMKGNVAINDFPLGACMSTVTSYVSISTSLQQDAHHLDALLNDEFILHDHDSMNKSDCRTLL